MLHEQSESSEPAEETKKNDSVLLHIACRFIPQTWPLPLTRQGLMEAAQNPIPQAVPTGPVSVKRQPSYHNQDGPPLVKAEKVCSNNCGKCSPYALS